MKNFILIILISISGISIADEKRLAKNQQIYAQKKAVLITGANSGLGLAMAEKLATEGFYVFAGARKQKDIDALNQKANMQGIRLDVTVQADIDAAVKTIEQAGMGLYGLVNNAGVTVMEPLIEVSEKSMQFQMDVNVFGPYRVTKAFAPLIIKSKGRIASVSSILGVTTGGITGPYSMSKHAIEAYSDALAAELKKLNVQVSVIEPGNYRSEIIKTMRNRMEKDSPTSMSSLFTEEQERLKQYIPADRSGFKKPDDVALAVLDVMTAETVKRRYLVAPTKKEADMAIRGALRRVVQLNQEHPFSLNNDEMKAMLDQLINPAEVKQ